MEIKHELLRDALHGLSRELGGNKAAASKVAEKYFELGMNSPEMHELGEENNLYNNTQNIFQRWITGDTPKQRQKIMQLQPAILAALPTESRARLLAGNSIEYCATRALKEHQNAITAALLHAPLAVFDRECDEAEREFAHFRQIARIHLH